MKTFLVGALTAGAILTACESVEQPPADRAAPLGLGWTQCPSEFAVTVVGRHRCGTLTVPVDHDNPTGPSLGLEVIHVFPEGDDSADVALSVGFNLGEPAQEPGLMAALAQRMGVSVISLAPRGVGDAGGTSLACPEFAEDRSSGSRSEPAARELFVEATRSCRARLEQQGADLSSFGTDDMAADLESLRRAVGVEQWYALVSYGEMSLVSDAYVATHEPHVRAVVKDSPTAPDLDLETMWRRGAESALAALFDECAADPRCSSRYPELEKSWQRALQRADARPLAGSSSDGTPTRVDAAVLRRAVRSMLGGNGPAGARDLPRVVTSAAEGQLHPALSRGLSNDSDMCTGYRPICRRPGFSMGAFLSQACPRLTQPGKTDARAATGGGVWDRTPYVDACAVWGVPVDTALVGEHRVPTLVITGHLDPWSRPEWFENAVVVRGVGHDVAGGGGCVLDVRRAWVSHPTADPDATLCDGAPFPEWD